jgi:hypothetical protein
MIFLIVFLVAAGIPQAFADPFEEGTERSAMGMFGDFILLRPLGFAATVIGAGVFVVSLPFSLIGRNTNEAAEKLVVEPFLFTFDRPLGDLP